MMAKVVFLAVVACGVAAYPVEYPGALYSQYHAQDELGQYTFGYSGPTSTKHEQKTADGVTRGTYSYVDPLGRTRSYTADDVNGFRVAASDIPLAAGSPVQDDAQRQIGFYTSPTYQAARQSPIPARTSYNNAAIQDTPEVAAAKAQHLAAVEQAKIRNRVAGDNYVNPHQIYTPTAPLPLEHRYVAAPYNPYFAQPALPAPMPLVRQHVPLPSGISSQYHAQDEAGQYTFGYANDVSVKSETKTADGVTRGSFSYLDPYGRLQSRSYVADEDGFRVVASDLPQVNIQA